MTDQETGVAAPDAGVQPTGAESTQQGQPEVKEETRQVPLSALMGVREELKSYKEKAQTLEQEMNQLRMAQRFAQPQPGQTPQDAATQHRQEADLLESLSDLSDDDLVDKKAIARVVKGLQERLSRPQTNDEVRALKVELAKVQLSAKDPEYENTIKTYLPEMALQNPAIEQTLRALPNEQKLMAAYSFAIMNPKYQQAKQGGQEQNPQPNLLEQLDRILENQGKPKNPAMSGGSSAIIEGADRIANMSSEEFRAFKERVKSGGR